jgi:tetratricopeptide (TPR) repeat protein
MDSDDEDGDDGAPVKNLVASCTELKAGGNEHFKAGRCDEAVTEYQKAVDRLTSVPAKKALAEFFKASPNSPDTASPLLASLHGNMAACHVKASRWESAIRAASEALKLEPDNLKARFRRGLACSHVGQNDEAKADLTAVARADPTNREARRVLELVNTALKQHRSSERAMFGKAFEGIRKEEESKAAAEAAAAAAAAAAAEAAELQAWRDECNALSPSPSPSPSPSL